MSVIAELFPIIAPVFLCAAAGFLWVRLGRPFDNEMVTAVVTNLGTPFLVFSTLTKLQVGLAAFAEIALAAILCGVGFAVLGLAALRLARLPAHSYLPSLIFPNCGNLGLPLCLFAFGEAGLALAIGVFAVASVGQFTIGIALAAGDWSPRRLLQTPILYALAAALAFMATGTRPPLWLDNTCALLGGLTIPLMLVALGAALARLAVARLPRALSLSLLRLAGGFAIGLLVARGLGLGPMQAGVLVIQASMPVAVFNYLFAARFRREPSDVAGMVVISTLLSFATLPALLLLVLP